MAPLNLSSAKMSCYSLTSMMEMISRECDIIHQSYVIRTMVETRRKARGRFYVGRVSRKFSCVTTAPCCGPGARLGLLFDKNQYSGLLWLGAAGRSPVHRDARQLFFCERSFFRYFHYYFDSQPSVFHLLPKGILSILTVEFVEVMFFVSWSLRSDAVFTLRRSSVQIPGPRWGLSVRSLNVFFFPKPRHAAWWLLAHPLNVISDNPRTE